MRIGISHSHLQCPGTQEGGSAAGGPERSAVSPPSSQRGQTGLALFTDIIPFLTPALCLPSSCACWLTHKPHDLKKRRQRPAKCVPYSSRPVNSWLPTWANERASEWPDKGMETWVWWGPAGRARAWVGMDRDWARAAFGWKGRGKAETGGQPLPGQHSAGSWGTGLPPHPQASFSPACLPPCQQPFVWPRPLC